MSKYVAPPLDFDVVKEEWNRYQLADGSLLKLKLVMTGVTREANQVQSSNSNYTLDVQNITTVLTKERGAPDQKSYSPKDLASSITKDDIRFTTVAQDWNEYVVDDGARVRIQPLLLKVSKTSKFSNKGMPIYTTDINMNIQVKPPGGRTTEPSR